MNWSIEAKLLTNEFDILRSSHLASKYLGRISRQGPEHEKKQKGYPKKDRDGGE